MMRNWPIRTRIALAIFGLSTGLLIVMSFAVYRSFDRELGRNLDDTLRLRAASNLQLVDTNTSPAGLAVSLDPGLERSQGEVVLRLFDPNGRILVDASPAAMTAPSEAALVRKAAGGDSEVYGSVTLSQGEDYRVVASPVRSGGMVVAVLVTGIERSQVNEPLAILGLILLIAVPVTSLAVGLGGFLIARGALKPISTIAATASQIAAGDLERRINGVTTRDEVGELAHTFNAMIGRLAEAVGRERRFTADASHELRTPLAAIETSIEVTLRQDRTADAYRHALLTVATQAHRLTTLTRQLLLLSRLDAEQARAHFDSVELGGLVEAVAGSFAEGHPSAQIHVSIQDGPLEVRGDVEQLTRAFLNILENAAVHAGPAVEVAVSASSAGGRLLVRISDNGPGIDPELATDVFQRFRRGDGPRSSGGSGLGLAIVESIVRLHGGEIRLVSPGTGSGARFEFSFPLAS